MGYYIFSYAINTKQIEEAIGSKNDELFNTVLSTDTFKNYSDQDFPGSISTKHALRHLIFGEEYIDSSAHSYWYAFIALCSFLGERLPSSHEIDLGYETDIISNLLESDFNVKLNIEEVLLTGGPSFGLPETKDFPVRGFLNKNDLLDLQSQLKDINITDEMLEKLRDEYDEKEIAYDSIRQIKRNVSWCLDNNFDLISFCH